MIKVKDGVPTREALPKFLKRVKQESLYDLSWTDPALGVSDCAWWPEVDESELLGQHEQYGDEILTIDAERKVVIVTHEITPWTSEQIMEEQNTIKNGCISAIDALIQSKIDTYNQANSTILKNISSCCNYKDEDMSIYPEQPFCAAVWEWNVNVWASAKQIMTQVQAGEITITSPDDVLAMLPEFTFGG